MGKHHVGTRFFLPVLPGLISGAMWAFALFGRRSRFDWVNIVGDGMAFAVWAMPLMTVLYLIMIGDGAPNRGTLRRGDTLVFVLKWGTIDLVLWGLGYLVLTMTFHYPA